MILLIGDLHYVPSGTPMSEAADVGGADDERALVGCIDHVSGSLTHVVLLGDVFDAYVEHRHLVPKGPVRLLGQLARLVDSGVEVLYAVGNHDPWQGTHLEEDLGFRILRRPETVELAGRRVHVSHGDRPGVPARILRHPATRSLYASLMPGGSGQGIAHRVSRLLGRRSPDAKLPGRLRDQAMRILESGTADVVASGHSHVPDLLTMERGTYVNPGFWPRHRLVGVVSDGAVSLQCWTRGTLVPYEHGPGQ